MSEAARIGRLGAEAGQAGDLRMAMIVVLALGGVEALGGADPGTEADTLLSEGRTQEWALSECRRVLADTEAPVLQ